MTQALPDAGGGEEEESLRETFQHSARPRTSASGSEDRNLPSSMNYQHIYILMRSPAADVGPRVAVEIASHGS